MVINKSGQCQNMSPTMDGINSWLAGKYYYYYYVVFVVSGGGGKSANDQAS